MTNFLLGLFRALAIVVLVLAVLALLAAGLVLGLSWMGDDAIREFSHVAELFGGDSVDDLRLPALWARLAPHIYTIASIAALSGVVLFIARPRKTPRREDAQTVAREGR